MPTCAERGRGVLIICGLLLAGAIASAVCESANAASGGQMKLPSASGTIVNSAGMPVARKPSGLTLSIDTTWVAANGYRPVRITIAPPAAAPLAANRTLEIRLTPHGYSGNYFGNGEALQVRQEVEVSAGSSGATFTVSVPQEQLWEGLALDVFEEGTRIDELSSQGVFINPEASVLGGSSPAVNPGERPTLLLLGIPSADAVSQVIRGALSGDHSLYVELQEDRTSQGAPAGNTAINPRLTSLTELPDRWVNYEGIDLTVLSWDELKRLVTDHPMQWRAIRKQITAGGTLIVYDVGANWGRLPEVEKLVDLPSASAEHAAATALDPVARGWNKPDLTIRSQPLEDDSLLDQTGTSRIIPGKASGGSVNFIWHALSRGQVVAAVDEHFPADATLNWWPWLLNSLGQSRWQWRERHGLVLDPDALEANQSNFWDFLIPGVGLTPVLGFQILISLFAILIGPVNYWLLRRWGRLNLLLITVPVSALLFTATLLGYAFIHDGLGVRCRVRSFTELDQRRGEAVCWSRLSYYAGLSPSRGMTFSGDVAVFPLRLPTEDSQRGRGRADGPERELEWIAADTPDGLPDQHLSSHWLPARVPTQFVTVRARPTPARLKMTGPAGGPPKVENRLGTRIVSLVLTDDSGHYFKTAELGDGQTAKATAVATSDALEMVRRVLRDNVLQPPAGSTPDWFANSGMNHRYRNGPTPSVQPGDSVLERSLREAGEPLAPRRFVAIVEHSPEVELGLDSASEEASLHVVCGDW